MGYRRAAKLTRLKWDASHDLHGLEVTLKPLTVDAFLKLTRLAAGFGGDMPEAEQAEKAGELFDRFAKLLVAWNLEDGDGQPVPADRGGVGSQDLPFILGLVMTWMETAVSVDSPLKPGSNGGPAPIPEASIPMAPLSPSLPS